MPHWPPPQWNAAAGVDAARMRRLLGALGNPHLLLPPVVHVAGTNGKGSTIALMQAMLEAAGYRVHVYTSPHLQHFEERMVLSGTPILQPHLHALLEECRLAAGDETPQFFEGTTVAALLAFARVPADIVLVETGMGGRFDPTNIIPEKTLTIITSISADHTDYLGKTLAEIAWHKAGIMRAGVPCIVAQQTEEVMDVLVVQAQEVGAPLYVQGQHWAVAQEPDGALYFEDMHGGAVLPAPALHGAHQYHNAGLAIAAMTALTEFDVSHEHIEQGLQHVQWPARLAPVAWPQLPANVEMWYDGGHNVGGAAAIAAHVQKHWGQGAVYLIFGTTQGKDVTPMIEQLLPCVDVAIMVRVRAEPKPYAPSELQASAARIGHEVQVAESLADAVDMLMEQHQGTEAKILVFGSLYFYAELQSFL